MISASSCGFCGFFPCQWLAKEHIRRNRQSRTFMVENVIGEIWSELEEGSVLSWVTFALTGKLFPTNVLGTALFSQWLQIGKLKNTSLCAAMLLLAIKGELQFFMLQQNTVC